MPVLTTSTFNLPIDEIMDLAVGRVTGERTNGYDATLCVRLLNLVFQEIQLKGVNLWTIEQATMPLVLGTASYTLPTTVVDLVNVVLRDTDFVGNDLTLPRWSLDSYTSLVDKTVEGRPSSFYLDRQRDAPVFYLYPVPYKATYEFIYWAIRRLYDVGRMDYNVDAPVRWMPAIVSGLAWYYARQNPKRTTDKMRAELKASWDEDFRTAAEEDRDKSPIVITPDLSQYQRP